jgi:7-carboxy-7-deazaguanine synthase
MRIAEIFRSLQGEGCLTGTPSVFVRTSGCNLRCGFCDTPYTSWEPEGEDFSVDEILQEVDRLLQDDGMGNGEESGVRSQESEIDNSSFIVHHSSFSSPAHPLTPSPAHSSAPCRHVVLTGGEPMLFAELVPLAAALRRRGLHITVETAGTLYLPLACDLMSISPKLGNSTPPASRDLHSRERHERSRHVPEVIRQLVQDYEYQIKFVIDSPQDCQEVETWLGEFPEIRRARVQLMPQGVDRQALAQLGQWLEPYCREHELQFCPRRHIEWFGNVRGT